MSLEHFDLQYNSAQKSINDKIFQCSSKLSENPNDFQSLFELILIAIHTQQYNLALNFINEGNKLLPLSSELFIAEIRVLLLKGEIEEAQKKLVTFQIIIQNIKVIRIIEILFYIFQIYHHQFYLIINYQII